MPYATISRYSMIGMLRFIRAEYDSLIAHRDHTFTARRRFTDNPLLAQAALVGKLRRVTRAVILVERTVQRGDEGYVEVRFAFEE